MGKLMGLGMGLIRDDENLAALVPVETFYLLQENGDKIILEDGSGFILLEAAP